MLRNKLFVFGLLAVLLISFSNTLTKENKSLKAKVIEVLEKYPAQNSEKRNQLSAELLQHGTEGILAVCQTLLAPGVGNDSNSRFALSGLSIYTNRTGAETERRLYGSALIKGLKLVKDNEVKAFLIRQLQLVGKDESIKTLSKYLKHKRLCEPATQALYTIGSKKAKKALVKALGSVNDENRVTIIKALGDLRCSAATKKLLLFAKSKNDKIRQTALYALANIGDPSAEKILSHSLLTASAYERNLMPGNFLLYARRLGESGDHFSAARICRQMIRSYPSEANVATSALAVLVDMLGEKALVDLLKAMDSFNEQTRVGALSLAAKIAGETATAQWIKKMGEVIPATKAKIVAMLGDRGDATAIPAVIESIQDSDESVRLAALGAITKLKKNGAIPNLLSAMWEGDETELKIIQSSLLTLDTDSVVNSSAQTIYSMPSAAQIYLLEIFSKRRAKNNSDVVWQLSKSEDDEVRLAALTAFEQLATEKDLNNLIQSLQQTENEQEIGALQKAIAKSVAAISDSNKKLTKFLKILKLFKDKKQAGLFDAFSQFGDPAGLELMVQLTKNKNASIQANAIQTLANWRAFEASSSQIELLKTVNNAEQKTQLLRGYLRLTRNSELPDYKKVKLLKQAMAASYDIKNKKLVLRGLSEINSIESVKYVASFINDEQLKSYAALMVRRIALPKPDGKDGLSSPELISILRKVASQINIKIEQERINGYLNTLLTKFSFVQLFNEEDLVGWKGMVESPPKRAKMSAEQLVKKQVIADSIMHAHWKVQENGVLFFDGKGQSLCTARDYQDFEMLVDWKIQKEGDSGIYLRGSPQVQIWDPAQWPEGSGGLYNNKKHPSKPLVKADNPIGEWNSFRIIMIGERVTVYLNDILVVDNVVLENYWERDKPIYPTGQIELQSHNSPLYFRNIYIREIKERKNFRGLSSREKEEGFELLFNGKDMTGWVGDTTGYSAENGKIVLHPEKSSGNLYTEKEFADFTLRFEFKLTPGANNGLGIRTPLKGNAAYQGMELQILENTHPKYNSLKPYQYHGSIYGVVPARRGFLNPVGEWNFEEVIAEGSQIRVILNGETIVRANIEEASANGTMDGRDHPGLKRKKGHIGFLGHGDHVEFRNLRIKEL